MSHDPTAAPLASGEHHTDLTLAKQGRACVYENVFGHRIQLIEKRGNGNSTGGGQVYYLIGEKNKNGHYVAYSSLERLLGALATEQWKSFSGDYVSERFGAELLQDSYFQPLFKSLH